MHLQRKSFLEQIMTESLRKAIRWQTELESKYVSKYLDSFPKMFVICNFIHVEIIVDFFGSLTQ